MKRLTIKELSKHLLLSTSTVSRAFTNDKNIHPQTRKVVLEAAEKLGYKPNPAALSLRYGKSKTVGVIVPEMITPFSSSVLRGIQNILSPDGYRIIIMQSDEDPSIEKRNLLLLEGFNVDAIIINSCDQTRNDALYMEVLGRGTPLIFFDRKPSDHLDVSKVVVNDNIEASLMVEHLIQTGKRRIAHIMGPPTIRNSAERAAGYKTMLQKYNIFDPNLIVETTGTDFQSGKKAVEFLINNRIEFDAIFAFTDTLAIGAMNYLLERSFNIPQQVGIASFSGTELSSIVYPPLTTVEPPLVQMGEIAANLTIDKILDINAESQTIFLAPVLIFRASTVPKR